MPRGSGFGRDFGGRGRGFGGRGRGFGGRGRGGSPPPFRRRPSPHRPSARNWGKRYFSWGPWSYWWPKYYGIYDDWVHYDGVPRSDAELALPMHWVGKKLVRRGETVAPNTPMGFVIFETQLPRPYLILGPGEIAGDYVYNRLTIYVDRWGIIENLRYG